MSAALVSTIVPVYNRPAMLQTAVASVVAQDYRPIEIIIIDDGSTDGCAGVCDRLAAENPTLIRVIHQSNRGVGMAREAGRTMARGEFIQHLDSDDVLLPSKFSVQVAALLKDVRAGVAYGLTRWVQADGKVEPLPAKRSGEAIETMFPAMLRERIWDTPTPLYRSSLVMEAGPWLNLSAEEDWEFDARIAATDVRLVFCPVWVCEMRRHLDGHLSGRPSAQSLRDRAVAHFAIYEHARRAGIDSSASEMQYFAREVFLMARQAGSLGLIPESQALFNLAAVASGQRNRLQLQAYRLLAAVGGWRVAGRLSAALDKLR